ncbi:MAG TPA: hypothetical protein VG937_19475 [Polyangiaceae bacterium]|nr:hypothetical protein [Polyangiaceae bacterium]
MAARIKRQAVCVALPSLLLPASPSWACPNCATALAARTAVLADDFWLHLGMTLKPLLVLAAICRRLYRIGLVTPPSIAAPATVAGREG